MRKHINAFFKRKPTKTALRLAYVFVFLLPLLWWAEEVVYVKERVMQRSPHESVATYHKIGEPDSKKPWCVLTLNPISPDIALKIAQAKKLVGDNAKVMMSGTELIDYRAKAGCMGVDHSRMYWVVLDQTQKNHVSAYLSFEVFMWMRRLIYMVLIVLAMGNIINRKHAKHEFSPY